MHVQIQRGAGGRTSPRKSQKYRFFSNTGPDPLNIVKLPCQLSILGHNRHASETPFRWQAEDGPLIVVFENSSPSN